MQLPICAKTFVPLTFVRRRSCTYVQLFQFNSSCNITAVAVLQLLQFYISCSFTSVAVFQLLQFYSSCSFTAVAVFQRLQFYSSCSSTVVAVLQLLQLCRHRMALAMQKHKCGYGGAMPFARMALTWTTLNILTLTYMRVSAGLKER
jgi:hypothetical protein